jgi:hypothetical protein
MFNLIRKKKHMPNKKVWLVIEKNNYGENNNSYSISKTADTIEKAMTFKVYLEKLNDRKSTTYFLASDIDTVMNSVAYHHNKAVENGTYDDKVEVVKSEEKKLEEEMPF